jgi:AraC-like DNA-binding protein
MLTGQYDKALALSQTVWPILREQTDDYGHLAGMCYCRGRSYLAKGDFLQASVWIDSLVFFSRMDQYNPVKRIKQSYLLRADYYTALGDARQAKIYNDSLVAVYRHSEEQYTSHYIARASAQYNNEKITAQSERLRVNRRRLIVISLIALCGFAAAFAIFSLYRRTNAAYKVLAQKAREWALENEPSLPQPPLLANRMEKKTPTKEDKRIMALIKEEMSVHYAYREPGLTAELLAARLGVHRNALSQAINSMTGSNFNQYVNSLRIKEAIRLMEGKQHKDLHIDEIYEGAGFGNHTSFYRAFKQFTGLSPIEFLRKS